MNGSKDLSLRSVNPGGTFTRLAVAAILFTTVAVLLIDCGKGTNSKSEPGYLLYAAMHGPTEGWIAVIDCATDSVIDSMSHGFYNPPGVTASPDGKYLAVLGWGRPPEIFDARTRTQIKYLASPSLGVLFLSARNIVLCPTHDSTLVYDIPGFNLNRTWPRPRGFTEPVGLSARFASADRQQDSGSNPIYQFIIFNPDGSPSDSFGIRQGGGDPLQLDRPFTFSSDGTKFFGYAFGTTQGACLVGYDLSSRTLLFLQRVVDYPRQCRLSPDGQEIWTTDPGDLLGFNPAHVGSIKVYNAATGNLKDSVSATWSYSGSIRHLQPWSIRFLPNSEKVYINSMSGPILVINSLTKKIDKLIFPGFDRHSEEIDIAPQP